MNRLFGYFSRGSNPVPQTRPSTMVGGYSQSAMPADHNIQNIVNQLSYEIYARSGYMYQGPFTAISYTSQVVAGTNYKIKVGLDGYHCIHLTVFQPLPYTGSGPQITNLEFNKTIYDPLI